MSFVIQAHSEVENLLQLSRALVAEDLRHDRPVNRLKLFSQPKFDRPQTPLLYSGQSHRYYVLSTSMNSRFGADSPNHCGHRRKTQNRPKQREVLRVNCFKTQALVEPPRLRVGVHDV